MAQNRKIDSLGDQIDRAQAQDHKSPEYDDMYETGPEIAGLPLLNESVGNEIKKSLNDLEETRIRTTQAD
jgi:hypothetical protein